MGTRIYPRFSGSAFNGNRMQAAYIWSHDPNKEKLIFISLADFCKANFISKKIGYTMIRKRLVIAKRLGHRWWVAQNDNCIEELKDYLDVATVNWYGIDL